MRSPGQTLKGLLNSSNLTDVKKNRRRFVGACVAAQGDAVVENIAHRGIQRGDNAMMKFAPSITRASAVATAGIETQHATISAPRAGNNRLFLDICSLLALEVVNFLDRSPAVEILRPKGHDRLG